MTGSYTISESFTKTDAKYLSSKVMSDLYQCGSLHGEPDTDDIDAYRDELTAMLAGGYVQSYEFGFKQNDERVLVWQYSINSNGELVGGGDDHSGGIEARVDVSGCSYYNFMSYTKKWFDLSEADKSLVKESHTIRRSTGSLPEDGDGYWESDRSYSSGGTTAGRRTYRPS